MHYKLFNYKFDKQRGATVILIAFFVMTVISMIALAAATIMMQEIKMTKEISNSIPALYAADAAAEQCLYEARKLEDGTGCSIAGGTATVTVIDATAIGIATRVDASTIESLGSYIGTKRKLELKW